jgi:hypothetical protein
MGGTLQLVVLSRALALVFEFMAPQKFKNGFKRYIFGHFFFTKPSFDPEDGLFSS